MSQRPRQHQLETESQLAFATALPSGWLFRPITPDYGVDGLVEVFDGSSRATGAMFFVQLKATDTKDQLKALSISLKISAVAYFRTLILPVLLVLFHAPTKSLYARLMPKAQRNPLKSKTTSVRMTEADLWGEAVVAEILAELDNVRAVGLREILMKEYYEAKRKIVPSDREIGKTPAPSPHLKAGDRVSHYVFGVGTVSSASDSYAFIEFDADEMTRKFEPGSFCEFLVTKSAA